MCLWVGCVLDLAPVGCGDTALDRDASPLTCGPSEPEVQPVRMSEAVRGVGGYTICLAHVELDLGHLGLCARDQGADAPAHGGLALGMRAKHEPGHVEEYDDG